MNTLLGSGLAIFLVVGVLGCFVKFTNRGQQFMLLVLLVGLLLLYLGVFVAADSPVTARVAPRAVMQGGSVRVTCTVPKHVDNRGLVAGLGLYVGSRRQLDGDTAPITHSFTFQKVPCYAVDAYCIVYRVGGKQFVSWADLLIAGCN